MRLGWRPGNEAGVEVWERGWGGGLGTRLGWRPGNEARVEAWERGWLVTASVMQRSLLISSPFSLFSAEKNLSAAEKERLATREKEKGNEVRPNVL